MRVFVTGATGFIGSAVVQDLLGAGHEVVGLARSDASADTLIKLGVGVHRGELTDLDSLAAGAKSCDGVIHLAFIHDFSKYEANAEIDRLATAAMATVMQGSGKPLVVTSGTLCWHRVRWGLKPTRPPRRHVRFQNWFFPLLAKACASVSCGFHRPSTARAINYRHCTEIWSVGLRGDG
jgi:nucleoside-diphosphate-sugar epimerase